jgi:8-oxo-dGTP pyrophosphatase MutT (NUDIX family)
MHNVDPRLEPVFRYLNRHSDKVLPRLREQLAQPQPMFARSNMTGHITASGLVLTPTVEVLLVAQLGLGKWLQPGGHVDADDTEIWQAAAREIREETGVSAVLHPGHAAHGGQPADIDTHAMPARPEKGEGAHWHHDCLFVFVTERTAIERQVSEVSAVCWCAITDERVPERLRCVWRATHS